MAVAPSRDRCFSCSPVAAEAALGQVHDLVADLGVLDLRDVDVLGSDPRGLEGRLGGLDGGARACC